MADTKVPQRAGAERPNDAATKRDHVVTYSTAWPVGLRYGVRRNTKRTPITRQPWGDTVVSRPLCRARAIEIRDALNRGEAFASPQPEPIPTPTGRRAEISYRTRDLGYGVEEGIVDAIITDDVDPWGKRTIYTAGGDAGSWVTMYLFADEWYEV